VSIQSRLQIVEGKTGDGKKDILGLEPGRIKKRAGEKQGVLGAGAGIQVIYDDH
jgi:hypothetical protein